MVSLPRPRTQSHVTRASATIRKNDSQTTSTHVTVKLNLAHDSVLRLVLRGAISMEEVFCTQPSAVLLPATNRAAARLPHIYVCRMYRRCVALYVITKILGFFA